MEEEPVAGTSRRTRRRLEEAQEPAQQNDNLAAQPSTQADAPGAGLVADPEDQRHHLLQIATFLEGEVGTLRAALGSTVSQQEQDQLVQQLMRMMLFQQQKRPGVPVRQSELASLVNSAYQGQRKKGLSSLIIAQAQHKFVELLGMEMAMFKLRTGKAATSQEAPSEGPASYVLRNLVPDDLRSLCVQPSKPAKLDHALSLVILQLIHHSNGPLYEDEMWRLLEKLAVVKGKAHPIFQVKPEDQLNGMLQRRILHEAIGEWVGAEGNPVKAYQIGESAADEFGAQIQAFDDQIFGTAAS